MADQKISALPAFTAASVSDDDQFIINDSSSGSFETKRISFSQLSESIGGTAGAQYITFFQGSDVNVTDNGISINNDGWWDKMSPDGSPKEIGSQTKTFIAPADSVGAIILFCSRMAHQLSDNIDQKSDFNDKATWNMKCFARCTQETPDCYWNTRAQANQTINGFHQNLITKVTPTPENRNFEFQTYHSAKWDYVTWATGSSTQDRTFTYKVTWKIDELGWSRARVGMNRVIILPMYEDPQVSTFDTGNYVDPFEQIAAGIIPSEFTIRSDQKEQFDAALNALTSSNSLNNELNERATSYKEAMDKIQRNALGYINQYDGNNNPVPNDPAGETYQDKVDKLKVILTELYELKGSASDVNTIEASVYGNKVEATPGTAEYLGLYGRTAEIVGFYWTFDNSGLTF